MKLNYLAHAHYEHVLLIIKNSTFLKQSFYSLSRLYTTTLATSVYFFFWPIHSYTLISQLKIGKITN